MKGVPLPILTAGMWIALAGSIAFAYYAWQFDNSRSHPVSIATAMKPSTNASGIPKDDGAARVAEASPGPPQNGSMGDPPKIPTNLAAERVNERLRLFASSPLQTFVLEQQVDQTMVETARKDVTDDGESCTKVVGLWSVQAVSTPIVKVDCGIEGVYQLTILNNREFIKSWTGVLLDQ